MDRAEKIKILKRLDALPADEYILGVELLSTMGIDIEKFRQELKAEKEKARRQAKIMLAPEYDMVILNRCFTCGTDEELFFHMTQDPEQWGLVGKPLEEKPAVYVHKTIHTDTCRNCERILAEKDVPSLMSLLFVTIDRLHKKIIALAKI